MRRYLALLFLALPAGCAFGYQEPAATPLDAKATSEIKAEAKSGFALSASTTVQASASVEAVLLPPKSVRRLFGGEIAKSYAAIALIISNRSRDAALIVHTVFIDYSRWALSGTSQYADYYSCASTVQKKEIESQRTGEAKPPAGPVPAVGGCGNPLQPWQTQTLPNQIASAESRLVRGQMLDAQPFTVRNWVIRSLEAAGSLATGFVFPFKERGIIRGIAAFNGVALPAARALWPDSSVAQANRISDFGFQVNKVIGKETSDVVVAFFPIDRFLTPGLKKIFLDSPAVFFAPYSLLIDPVTSATFDNLFPELSGCKLTLRANLPAHIREQQGIEAEPADQTLMRGAGKSAGCPLVRTQIHHALDFLDQTSLNTLRVVVGGIMAVDVDSIPANITAFECDDPDQKGLIWAEPGDRTCVVRGQFLSNGTPVIAEASTLGINVATVTEGSTDQALHVKLTLSKAVPPKSTLTLLVNKKDKQGRTVESMKFPYHVPDYKLAGPVILGNPELKDGAVTVKGSNFYDTADSPLTVTLHATAPKGVADQKIDKPTRTLTQLKFDVKTVAPACWLVQVKVGEAKTEAVEPFALSPAPKITSAKLAASKLTVAGEQFADLAACKAPLTFELLSDAAGAKPQAVATKVDLAADGKQASFDVPAAPTGAKWKEVHVLVNGKQADSHAIE